MMTSGVRDGIRHPGGLDVHGFSVFPGREDVTHTAFVAMQTIEYLRGRAATGPLFLGLSGMYSSHSP
ncbi:MAG: hypothetical protein AB7W28_07240 [Armatimonadota bacterium]